MSATTACCDRACPLLSPDRRRPQSSAALRFHPPWFFASPTVHAATAMCVARLLLPTPRPVSFFPSSLCHPISIPISPLHHVLFSHRSTATRARCQGPPCRPPEQSPTRLRPHLPEQCPGIEQPATKLSPQEVTKFEPTPSTPAVRAPHH
jgi:hypothetical protein